MKNATRIKRRAEKEKAEQESARRQKKLDEKFMRAALSQAKKARLLGEVPIGCVIVNEDKIIARGYNRRNTERSSLSHAEMTAIKKACKKLHDWRLNSCTLYVTLEPCQMCSGAIIQSRIGRIVIGAKNPKAGCAGSVCNILEDERFMHRAQVERDVLLLDCSKELTDFFSELRNKKKSGNKNIL